MLAADAYTEEEGESDNEGDFEVEKVVEHIDNHDGTSEYKLRWKGYDHTHDTWHHQDDCSECMIPIAEYWKKLRMSTAVTQTAPDSPDSTGSPAVATRRAQAARVPQIHLPSPELIAQDVTVTGNPQQS